MCVLFLDIRYDPSFVFENSDGILISQNELQRKNSCNLHGNQLPTNSKLIGDIKPQEAHFHPSSGSPFERKFPKRIQINNNA
ncbi:hypothetical protein TNCV_2374071 [Trichonephila clavipes]|nr:hypothetical protein TNCV_2374071 [Trichonephila clavipes]